MACAAGRAGVNGSSCSSARAPTSSGGRPVPRVGRGPTCSCGSATFRGSADRQPRIAGVTVPSRDEAARILIELEPPDWLLAHSVVVAEVAAFLAERLRDRLRDHGHELPADLPETAALLHDVDKTAPLRDLRKLLGHGWAGAAWLTGRGYDELAPAVAGHPATRLADEAAFTRWLADATWPEKIVAYADKRAEQEIVSMDERFATWQARHPERADQIARGRALANTLEQQVCAAANVTPTDVVRLTWVPIASRT